MSAEDAVEDPQLSASLEAAAAAGLVHELPAPLEHREEEEAHPQQQLPQAPPQEHPEQAAYKQEEDGPHESVAAAVVDHGQVGGGEDGVSYHHEQQGVVVPHPQDPAQAEAAAVAAAAAPPGDQDPAAPYPPGKKPKKRGAKKLPLTPHEALLFAPRGVYFDLADTGRLRCSCNHKPCDKWDQYGYARHFTFKVHRRYEEERLDDAEIQRLREAKEAYMRLHPVAEETSIRRKRKMREGEKMLSVDELRVQERHWMAMWKDAKDELRQMRRDLKTEADEEVRAELAADIEGLKRRKGDWARLLGLTDAHQDFSVNL